MGEKIVVGPINKGLRNDVTPFNIDNDSFPTLINAYQWRSRLKRKRGTAKLTRLRRYFNSLSVSYSTIPTITLDGSGDGNILTGFSLETNGNIIPGTVTLTASGGPTVYTDPTMDGYLTPTGTGGPNTINYATGDIHIPAQAGNTVSAVFSYYPDLPVMGIKDFFVSTQAFLQCISFDTKYSYNVLTASPYDSYDVSFYKNPPTGTYVGYVEKTNVTPTSWNGQDYQQFWTVNYQGAFWATNGINVPFQTTNVGMQYNTITAIAIVAGGPPAIVTITTSTNHGLSIGDFVYINEVVNVVSPKSGMFGINFQTGYVTAVPAANQITVEFPNAIITGAYVSGGIVQYLTNRSDPTKDCLRWYDGDPTNGNVTTPVLDGHKGWVNFAPPLSQSNFSIADLPSAKYYLVGARMIVPFKDRLLFFGPVVQTSSAGSQVYLSDTVIYSQNGTPYYTVSYENTPDSTFDTPTSATNVYNSILLPTNQTGTAPAYFGDVTGFGGFLTAGTVEEIRSVSINEDVLIVGFERSQTRLVYSGNDIVPFNFFYINSELGTTSTFSANNLDKGVISRGSRGIVITSQTNCARIDVPIPDEVFRISNLQNGTERVCSQRDFINEWIYFTYPNSEITTTTTFKFPNQTLQFNYRDDSWSINRESYTTYGLFRRQSGFTWQTVGNEFPTWADWNQPWSAGTSDLLQPEVAAGNQQGFLVLRDQGTGETPSLYIQSFAVSVVTSPFHGLNDNDFIIITGCLGSIGSEVNGKTFQINVIDENTFILNPLIAGGTYFGGGLIKRLYIPFIQSKQFPVSWQLARKTRLGPQQYLLSTTQNSQMTLLIYLSQNGSSPYNDGPIVPEVNSINNSLVYSTVLYTCPESTNLGLTPANTNLNMVTAPQQSQIWHRINTSLLGDTVQVGFTLSEAQMFSYDNILEPLELTGASQTNPCVLDCINAFDTGDLIKITGVVGMDELNFDPLRNNIYLILSTTATQITIEVDATGFGAYASGGEVQRVQNINQTEEIEIHGFILDVSPSSMLA